MENININFKTKLCKNYQENGKCKIGDKCLYAHGVSELRKKKKECINKSECFKKNCPFLHPEGWDYKNNTKICDYYKKGECINNDCVFNHVLNTDNNIDISLNNENNNKPVVNIFVNGIEYEEDEEDHCFIDNKNDKNLVNKIEYLDIINLTDNLYLNFEKSISDLKNIIEEKDKCFQKYEKENIINIKIELNKLLSDILLLKYNIKDALNYNIQ